jgi:tetratricopeptide (TPR) repeat protein
MKSSIQTFLKWLRQKHKAKRKAKQKQRRIKNSLVFQKEKADFLFNESLWLRDQGKFEEALSYAEKALRLDPKNKEMLHPLPKRKQLSNFIQTWPLSRKYPYRSISIHLLSNMLWPTGNLPLLNAMNSLLKAIRYALKSLSKISSVSIIFKMFAHYGIRRRQPERC